MVRNSAAPVIVFGAFDRHNFGDLLFPHILSALLPARQLIFAGLAKRDLRPYGGFLVHALPSVVKDWRDEPPVLLHAGGELMGCDAWEAAVMLQAAEKIQATIRRLHGHDALQRAWAQQCLQIDDAVPYMVSARRLPPSARILYNAVGGVDIDLKPPEMRGEILSKLAAADAVGVRDRASLHHLEQAGVPAILMPDPAALTAELFTTQITVSATQGEVSRMRAAFPGGYVAMQFSADFGDDATLYQIEQQVRCIGRETGYGVVLFCAGLAPWHDDREVYERLAARFSERELRLFSSAHLWDVCALIAHSRTYCGSSLHGRIVAMAFGLPRLNLVHDAVSSCPGKQAAYAASWDSNQVPSVTPPATLHACFMQALSLPVATRRHIAQHCVSSYRQDFRRLCEAAGL